MYRAARISRDLELTHCAVMYTAEYNFVNNRQI